MPALGRLKQEVRGWLELHRSTLSPKLKPKTSKVEWSWRYGSVGSVSLVHTQAWVSSQEPHKAKHGGMVANSCGPSSTQEAEAGESRVDGLPQLHYVSEASLAYLRPCLGREGRADFLQVASCRGSARGQLPLSFPAPELLCLLQINLHMSVLLLL